MPERPRVHLRAQTTWIAVIDFLCLVVGSIVGVALTPVIGPEDMAEYVFQHLDGWLIFSGSVILANYLAGAYRLEHTFSRFNLIVTWLFSLLFALLVLSATSYAWLKFLLGRGVLFRWLACYSALSLFMKLLVYRGLFRSEIFLCRTVIIGTGERAKQLRTMVENDWVLPLHRVVAFINLTDVAPTEKNGKDVGRHANKDLEFVDGVAFINTTVGNLEAVVASLNISLVVVGLEQPSLEDRLYPVLRRIRFSGTEVLGALVAAEVYCGRTPLDLIDQSSLLQASLESGLPVSGRMKRLSDFILALVGGVVGLVVGSFVSLFIKLSDPKNPVFYVQERIGQFGRPFQMYKFRTMIPGAEEDTGPIWAEEDDVRITRLGRFLRRFRLDEIPQLLNVLKGDMSIVGPRPERPEIVAELVREIPYYDERANVMPGVTGWAQIRHPYAHSIEDARRKLEYDLYYIKNMSLSLDLQIVLRTIRIVLFGKERAM